MRGALRGSDLVHDVVGDVYIRADQQARASRLPSDTDALRTRLRFITRDVIRSLTADFGVAFFLEDRSLAGGAANDNGRVFRAEAPTLATERRQEAVERLNKAMAAILDMDPEDQEVLLGGLGREPLNDNDRQRLARVRRKLRRRMGDE